MRQFDLSKFVFYFLLTLFQIVIVLVAGMYSARHKTSLYKFIWHLNGEIQLVIKELPILTKTRPVHFLQPAIYEGNGVTINKKNNNDYILISSFYGDNNEIHLIKRDGEIVARWPIYFSNIFTKNELLWEGRPHSDWNAEIHGILILPDGSIVFNFEYNGLVKLNKCGKVIWKVARHTHHSVEVAEGGGFWVPSRMHFPEGKKTPYPPFQPPFYVDTIMKVSDNGKILDEKSVPDLFYKNNLAALLTATGEPIDTGYVRDREIVHVNKIVELSSELADDFPLFKAGDLAISIRQYNLVMVIDPEQLQIKWLKTGPWLRQHDPEFKKGGKISVFNNNTYRNAFINKNQTTSIDSPRISNIMEIDPITNKHEVVYGGKAHQEMLSVIRGKHELLHDGGILITEFEGGRVFEIDKEGDIVWQYINLYDENEVAEITEARLYAESYFTVKDWSCASI